MIAKKVVASLIDNAIKMFVVVCSGLIVGAIIVLGLNTMGAGGIFLVFLGLLIAGFWGLIICLLC